MGWTPGGTRISAPVEGIAAKASCMPAVALEIVQAPLWALAPLPIGVPEAVPDTAVPPVIRQASEAPVPPLIYSQWFVSVPLTPSGTGASVMLLLPTMSAPPGDCAAKL